MNSNYETRTAKIIAFPLKRAASAGGQRTDSKARAEERGRALAFVEAGSGWYHEAALRDTDRTRS